MKNPYIYPLTIGALISSTTYFKLIGRLDVSWGVVLIPLWFPALFILLVLLFSWIIDKKN